MHIKSLFIKDFGIFNNADLDGLAPGIVVIGGKNRAGKSSLLKLLRNAPYGLEKGQDIPPFNINYEIEGRFKDGNDEDILLRIKGYSNPIIKSDKREYVDNLYKDVDIYTYKELFTISLDELQNLNANEEKLQAVLLGAGFKDIIKFPKLIEGFKKEAEKFGGKNGNPKTKAFKPYTNEIMEGLALRENISKEIKIYSEKNNMLNEVYVEIETLNARANNLEDEILILETLFNNYDTYIRLENEKLLLSNEKNKNIYEKYYYKNLSVEYFKSLKEDYLKVSEDYELAALNFSSKVSDSKEDLTAFQAMGENIRKSEIKSAKIQSKIENYNELLQNIKLNKENIVKEMMDINDDWKDDFTQILSIRTDSINFNSMGETIEQYFKTKGDLEASQEKKEELKRRKQIIKEIAVQNPSKISNSGMLIYIILATAFIVGGIALNYYVEVYGILFSATGIGIAFLFAIIKVLQNGSNSMDNPSKQELINIEVEEKECTIAINNFSKTFEEKANKIDEFRNILRLKEDVAVSNLYEYFRAIREAKKKVLDLKNNIHQLNEMKKNINKDLMEVYKVINIFKGILKLDEKNIENNFLDNSEVIFEALQKLNGMLDYYDALSETESLKRVMDEKIEKLLEDNEKVSINLLENIINELEIYNEYKLIKSRYENLKNQLLYAFKAEKVKRLFLKETVFSEENLLDALNTQIGQYNNCEVMEEKLRKLNGELKEIKNNIEKAKEDALNIKKDIEKLYSNEDEFLAQEKIEKGRMELKVLAEKYAANAAAAYILNKVQERFIEKTKDSLLTEAGNILNQITEGEIVTINQADNLSKVNFNIKEKNNEILKSQDVLSRGTKEQLFLSVRLSRIKEMETKLPIIIDDSLVNFDSFHLKKVIKVLKSFSKTNQIFILTCHSEVVDMVFSEAKDAQFYKIEKGKFYKTEGKVLSNYLSAK